MANVLQGGYIEYDGKHSLEEFPDWVKENLIDPNLEEEGVQKGMTDLEQAQINYIKYIMQNTLNIEGQADLYEHMETEGDILFSAAIGKGGAGQVGTFLEQGLFGLRTMENAPPSNLAEADIPGAGELKVNISKLKNDMKITAGQLTIYGGQVELGPGDDPSSIPEIQEIEKQLKDVQFRASVALAKMWKKMQYFLFIRITGAENGPVEDYHHLHFEAIIYFMRLIMRRLVEHIYGLAHPDSKTPKLVKPEPIGTMIKKTSSVDEQGNIINVKSPAIKLRDAKKVDTKGIWEITKTIEINITRKYSKSGYPALKEFLADISNLYAFREDFVNELSDNKVFAAEFFRYIKTQYLGRARWINLMGAPIP